MTAVLAVFLLLQAGPAPSGAPATEPKKPVRVYTNDDLDRVHPHRHETGVSSEPAYSPPPPARARPAGKPRTRGEDYWRQEAARVRERVAGLRAQADELRADLAARQATRRAEPVGRARSGASEEARLGARIAGLQSRIRLIEDELQDRARRQGALPGWLR